MQTQNLIDWNRIHINLILIYYSGFSPIIYGFLWLFAFTIIFKNGEATQDSSYVVQSWIFKSFSGEPDRGAPGVVQAGAPYIALWHWRSRSPSGAPATLVLCSHRAGSGWAIFNKLIFFSISFNILLQNYRQIYL